MSVVVARHLGIYHQDFLEVCRIQREDGLLLPLPRRTGLMTGRVALLWLNQKARPCVCWRPSSSPFQVGERRVLFIYGLLAIVLELVVWLVPSLISGAVSVSVIGVLLGPMYPITMNHAGRVLPAWLLTGNVPGRTSALGRRRSCRCDRLDWMDRWFRPGGVGVIAVYDGCDCVQVGHQCSAPFVSAICLLIPLRG